MSETTWQVGNIGRLVPPHPLDRPGGSLGAQHLLHLQVSLCRPGEKSKDARLGALTMHSGICCQEYRDIYEFWY
jgi:hypothetical protein